MRIEEEEAKKLCCPFMLNNPFIKCIGEQCMAWKKDTVWKDGEKGSCVLLRE